MSNSEIEQSGTIKGHLPNEASLSGRISNGLSLSGHISIGSGAGDFIIKMMVTSDDNGNYTVTSCDATVEQIDAAVADEKRVVVIATDTTSGGFWEMPLVQAFHGETYIFMAYTFSGYVMSTVYKYGENETWEFVESGISSESIDYYDSTQQTVINVKAALDNLVPKSHTHANKLVLDKFAESDGKPTYDGEDLGVASDFIIKMTIEVNGDNYTVTSCDKTMEQIDAAVASGQNIKAIAFDKYVMPMTQMEYSESYTFGAFLGSFLIAANVAKNHESGTDDWQFFLAPITADIVEYSNVAMPRISTVSEALDKLVPNSHTHTNKLVIDKFTETDGKPTYDGETLGSDFIIKMTVTSDDNGNYTVTSCDTTVEQIDAAVVNEKRVVLIATDTDNNLSWDIPIVQGFNGSNYYFATFLLGQAILSFVQKVGENKARWQFMVGQIGADFIGYSNDALPNMSTVGEALDALVTNSHSHSNKAVLDKFAETDGKPTYNGEALGSGAGDFIIKMTVESNGSELIVTSCDTTVEQIDEAVAAEKRVVLIASIDSTILELPMIQGNKGYSYYFGAFLSESVIFSTVYKTENTSSWAFAMMQIWAGVVDYSNDALPNVTDVESALNELVSNSHTHSNKDTLDKLSDSNGKLQYNSSDILTKSDKQEIIDDVLAALPTWTGGSY